MLVDGAPAPDRNDEYRFYQVLTGAWLPEPHFTPDEAFVRRLQEYMLKACKEAKTHTSWINDNQAYDEAITAFVSRCLAEPRGARFRVAFQAFHERFRELALGNSLAQLLVKLASPGVPDIYQGCEFWDFSLVDPDNRRPVDFASREQALAALQPLVDRRREIDSEAAQNEVRHAVREMMTSWHDSRIKLWVTATGLNLRREMATLFKAGGYLPLETEVGGGAQLVAFARTWGNEAVVAVVPRLLSRLGSGWQEWAGRWDDSVVRLPESLADRRWHNLVNGDTLHADARNGQPGLPAARLLNPCPVALLRAV
jgi:(1->4)-alpha-D-glucan 1-alpha-D-glucosylmutase